MEQPTASPVGPIVPASERTPPGGTTESDPHAGHGYTPDRSAYLKRLKRIEGQVRGIHRMVEEDVYCIDVLTQVAAATKALQSVSLALMGDHLRHCVADAAVQADHEGRADLVDVKVAEATAAIGRLLR